MGFIAGYDNDIFISYAHEDNEPPDGETSGWVDIFENQLRKQLRLRLGEEVTIFRDRLQLIGRHNELHEQMSQNSAVLVCVLSPSYMEWCLHELRQFYGRSGSERIIKVDMARVEISQQPPEIRDNLGYTFYGRDERSGRIATLSPKLYPDDWTPYLMVLDDLADDLAQLLKSLKSSPASPYQTLPINPARIKPEVAPLVIPTPPASNPGARRVFISYRREDSAPYAGRVFDGLSQRFGEECVFMDIDTIEPGEDFVEVLERATADCVLLLALIGKRWIGCVDKSGRRRLEDPNDFVRLEIAKALERKIRVIPLLVQEAEMPRAEDLPENLQALTRRHALELSDSRWKYDIGRLIEAVSNVLEPPSKL